MRKIFNKIFVVVLSLVLLSSCGVSKHLVYKDDWQGNYTLVEFNSCCDVKTKVKMNLEKKANDQYTWKLFFENEMKELDTLLGVAHYQKNKLNFYLKNSEISNKYFGEVIDKESSIFNLEYDRYYRDKSQDYIDYFTRWNHSIIGFKRTGKLFGGTDFHFKRNEKKIIY